MHILRMNPSIQTCACGTGFWGCIWSHHKHTHKP